MPNITGFHVHALDGEIGHVDDLLMDEESWEVRYLVVDTSNWIGGKWVLVSPRWARRVDWLDARIHFDLSREQVKNSPEFDPSIPVTTEYEDRLLGHYRQPASR